MTMRGFDEDDFREVGEIIVGALAEGADLDALPRAREELCGSGRCIRGSAASRRTSA